MVTQRPGQENQAAGGRSGWAGREPPSGLCPSPLERSLQTLRVPHLSGRCLARAPVAAQRSICPTPVALRRAALCRKGPLHQGRATCCPYNQEGPFASSDGIACPWRTRRSQPRDGLGLPRLPPSPSPPCVQRCTGQELPPSSTSLSCATPGRSLCPHVANERRGIPAEVGICED